VIDLPNGSTAESIKVSDLAEIYPSITYEQFDGFLIYESLCESKKINIITRNSYFSEFDVEDILRAEKEVVIGFSTTIEKSIVDSTVILKCLSKIFKSGYVKSDGRWYLNKEDQIIGFLKFNSIGKKYFLVLCRDEEQLNMYSK
jgi:hypothetical protein